jgi:hypothetical protein
MRYRGKTPVKAGDKVELLALDDDGTSRRYSEAKVVDALATQFTCRFNKRVHFYFYEDKGVTWRKISD